MQSPEPGFGKRLRRSIAGAACDTPMRNPEFSSAIARQPSSVCHYGLGQEHTVRDHELVALVAH